MDVISQNPTRFFLLWLALFIGLWAVVAPIHAFADDRPVSQEEIKSTDDSNEVEVVADQLEYDRVNKKVIGKGNVVLTYKGTRLSSDYAEVETQTKKAYAKGHVVIVRGEQMVAHGNEVRYDFANNRGEFPDGSSINGPWFSKGEDIQQTQEGKYEIRNGVITTCDRDRPHYEIRAKRVSIYTGDKLLARNVWLYILGKPVFWWPYLVFPLQENERRSPIEIRPGYSSQDGAYILTSKGYSITKWLWGRWHIDWRQKRGFGVGADFDYHFKGLPTDGNIRLYLTEDHNAPSTAREAMIGDTSPYAERKDKTRGRVTWRHRTDFTPHTYLIGRYHQMADEFFLQDFFEKEFRSDIEPTTFANFTHNSERYGFYLFNQARINNFDAPVERLPEIRFDWKNAPFFHRNLYYQSATSFANLNKTFARTGDDESNIRFDTFHEWFAPLKWNELKFTPTANVRQTLYGREREDGDSAARTALGLGFDARTHYYKVYDKSFDVMGIEANQLRHVVEPSFRYDGILHSSLGDEDLSKFDSIDTIDNAQRFTLGLENRIQTKRVVQGKMRRIDLVSLNTFVSYDIHPDYDTGRSGFSIWSNELTLRPYQWMQYEMRFDYDMERDRFREFNQDLLLKGERLRLLFGHRFVGRREFLGIVEDNNQFVFDGGYWLNDKWRLGGYVRFEAESHQLEEWQISATRDLHDFLLDFGYNVRNSQIDNSNKEFFFLFRLKAFPEYPLKSGNRAEFAEPRIGQTVAGVNQAHGFRGVEG